VSLLGLTTHFLEFISDSKPPRAVSSRGSMFSLNRSGLFEHD
jgi:hypothetical protein